MLLRQVLIIVIMIIISIVFVIIVTIISISLLFLFISFSRSLYLKLAFSVAKLGGQRTIERGLGPFKLAYYHINRII